MKNKAKILFQCSDKIKRELLIGRWPLKFNLEIIAMASSTESLRELSQSSDKKAYDLLIIADNNIDPRLIETITKDKLKAIFYNQSPQENTSVYIKHIDLMQVDQLEDILVELFSKDILIKQNQQYTAINLGQLNHFALASVDYYIKLSESKYLKIINQNDLITPDMLNKYQEKKVSSFYIKTKHLPVFLKEGNDLLKSYLKDQSGESASMIDQAQGMAINQIHQSFKEIGINEETIEMSRLVVRSVLNTTKENQRLAQFIERQIQQKDFYSGHGLATAILACAIIDEMDWAQDFIKQKLVTAALFHDIGLDEQGLSLIQTQEDLKLLAEKEKELYQRHPIIGAELISKIPELPANVDTLILEHHERPSGKGFPRGLNSFTITPLSCVLILAEQFYHQVYELGLNKEARNQALASLEQEYNKGHFKAPFSALVSLFL